MNLQSLIYMQAPKHASESDLTFKHAKTSDGWITIFCISITIEIYSTYLHMRTAQLKQLYRDL